MWTTVPCAAVAVATLAGSPALQDTLVDMLVTDSAFDSVKRYDAATGARDGSFVPLGGSGLEGPVDLVLGPGGDVLVSGAGNPSIFRFDRRTAEPAGSFTRGYELDTPTKMSWGPDGHLYVSQWGAGKDNVVVFDSTGAFVREATPALDDPTDHAWDAAGNLLVASYGTGDIRRFDSHGTQLEVLIDDPRLEGPTGLAYDADGNLRVVDEPSGAIYVYSPTGVFVDSFATGLQGPKGITVGPDGNLYIPEAGARAIARLDPVTGNRLATLGFQTVTRPSAVLFKERPALFALSPPVQGVTLGLGGTAEADIEVSPVRDVPFDMTVELTCTPGDPGVECAVAPATVTPAADKATATVIVSAPSPQVAGVPAPVAVAVALALLLGLRVRRSRMAALLLGVGLVAACADESVLLPREPIETVVAITGSGDGLRQQVSISVTVQ